MSENHWHKKGVYENHIISFICDGWRFFSLSLARALVILLLLFLLRQDWYVHAFRALKFNDFMAKFLSIRFNTYFVRAILNVTYEIAIYVWRVKWKCECLCVLSIDAYSRLDWNGWFLGFYDFEMIFCGRLQEELKTKLVDNMCECMCVCAHH